MTGRTKHGTMLMVVVAAVALVVLGAMAVMAGSDHGGGKMADMHGQPDGRMAGVHEQLQQIMEKLNLTPEQSARVDRARAIIEKQFSEHARIRSEEINSLVASIGDGTLDRAQVRAKIDAHLDGVRETAYDASDELVDFVNSLTPDQRATLKSELTKMHESAR